AGARAGPGAPADGGPAERADRRQQGGVGPAPPARAPATAADQVWQAANAATVLRAGLGRAGGCPPQLAEAVAALQDLAVGLAPPGQAASHRDQLWQLQSGPPTGVPAGRGGAYPGAQPPRPVRPAA